ncbi:MAG: GNAT family N-acetyltransferase [Bacteroidota bacterium]
MRIQRIEEFKISRRKRKAIGELLGRCFPEYPGQRTYYKQIPAFRYLVWADQRLVGHLAVEHRMMNVGGEIASIFGIVDLCVDQEFQSRKIASQLLQTLEDLGRKHKIDFLVLAAQEYELYENNGFHLVSNTCRWLMINEHQTLGVNHRSIDDCLMVKALGSKQWKSGLVDFLGHVF